MQVQMSEAQWIDAFVSALTKYGVHSKPDALVTLAKELYPTMNHLMPKAAAGVEVLEWLSL